MEDLQSLAGQLHVPQGIIRLFSGKYISIVDLQPGDMTIEEIAYLLSTEKRFHSGTKKFLSVAEHSLMCSYIVPENEALDALMHDSSESILTDMPSPIKALLPDYKKVEDKIMGVFARQFSFVYPKSEEVDKADRAMLEYEWGNFIISDRMKPMTPEKAEAEFLLRFYSLTKEKPGYISAPGPSTK